MFFNNEKKSSNQSSGLDLMSSLAVIALYACSIFCFLGIVINMIICLVIWGDFYHMYRYITAGYIAGFIVTGLSLLAIAFINALFKFMRVDHPQVSLARACSIISVICTIALMIFCALPIGF